MGKIFRCNLLINIRDMHYYALLCFVSCSIIISHDYYLAKNYPKLYDDYYRTEKVYSSQFLQGRLIYELRTSSKQLAIVAEKNFRNAVVICDVDSLDTLAKQGIIVYEGKELVQYVEFILGILPSSFGWGGMAPKLVTDCSRSMIMEHLTYDYQMIHLSTAIEGYPEKLGALSQYFVDVTDSLKNYYQRGNIGTFNYVTKGLHYYMLKPEIDSITELLPKVKETQDGYIITFYAFNSTAFSSVLLYKQWHVKNDGSIEIVDQYPVLIASNMLLLW